VRCVRGDIELRWDEAEECTHQGIGGIVVAVRDVERCRCFDETVGGV
jgi:hypothetical protein